MAKNNQVPVPLHCKDREKWEQNQTEGENQENSVNDWIKYMMLFDLQWCENLNRTAAEVDY